MDHIYKWDRWFRSSRKKKMDKYICLWDMAEFSELCHKNSETKKDKIDSFDFLNFCVADN